MSIREGFLRAKLERECANDHLYIEERRDTFSRTNQHRTSHRKKVVVEGQSFNKSLMLSGISQQLLGFDQVDLSKSVAPGVKQKFDTQADNLLADTIGSV